MVTKRAALLKESIEEESDDELHTSTNESTLKGKKMIKSDKSFEAPSLIRYALNMIDNNGE